MVLLNTVIFAVFALSFSRPKTSRDWRSFGAFSAFLVALFTEMYGFPLTIYLLSGWLGSRVPALNFSSHDGGHLWYTLLGSNGDPHFTPLHLLSNLSIAGGFILIGRAWSVLFKAQRDHTLATTGLYSCIRHPQYVGFIVVMLGFLLQWPTIPTLIMFPILILMYVRLANYEEAAAVQEFGEEYKLYRERTPAFWPWAAVAARNRVP